MTIKEKRLEQLKRALKTWQAKEQSSMDYRIEYEGMPMDLILDWQMVAGQEDEKIDYMPNFA